MAAKQSLSAAASIGCDRNCRASDQRASIRAIHVQLYSYCWIQLKLHIRNPRTPKHKSKVESRNSVKKLVLSNINFRLSTFGVISCDFTANSILETHSWTLNIFSTCDLRLPRISYAILVQTGKSKLTPEFWKLVLPNINFRLSTFGVISCDFTANSILETHSWTLNIFSTCDLRLPRISYAILVKTGKSKLTPEFWIFSRLATCDFHEFRKRFYCKLESRNSILNSEYFLDLRLATSRERQTLDAGTWDVDNL